MAVAQAVILCGGLGERMRPYTDLLPKPMIPVNGRPFLEYLVEQLRDQGIARIVLLTGYRAAQIENHFGDGHRFGVTITYSQGPVEWDTGRRVWEARSRLDPRFLLLYSDNFVPFRLCDLLEFHRDNGRMLSLLLSAKANGNIKVGSDGIVQHYDPSRSSPGLDHVEIGFMVVERDAVLSLIEDPDISFSRVLVRLASCGELAGLICGDRYHSISDPKRWKLAEQYLRLKRTLLIDRDGTLNVRPPQAQYLSRWDDFQWIPGAREGLEALSGAGFSFALISNQAGIARGIVTRQQVEAINQRLREDLAGRGITMTNAYVCPHHWDDGCTCRKPAPGLFFQASHDLLLRLDRTFYLCDDPRDCEAAYNANSNSVFVGDDEGLSSLRAAERPGHVARTILEAAPWLESRFESWERHSGPTDPRCEKEAPPCGQ
jgi:histidinol-phosphate phosphatase family protein